MHTLVMLRYTGEARIRAKYTGEASYTGKIYGFGTLLVMPRVSSRASMSWYVGRVFCSPTMMGFCSSFFVHTTHLSYLCRAIPSRQVIKFTT